MQYYLKIAIFLSFILHLMLGSLFFIHFNQTPTELASPNAKTFQSYLVTAKHNHNNSNSSIKNIAKLMQKNKLPKKVYTYNNIAENNSSPTKTNSKHSELLIKLHNLIEQNTLYPEGILNDSNIKSTTVTFILFPNGEIKNIRTTKSSEIIILDQAVISSIDSIQPIIFASKFLTQPEEFSVTVEFQK